MPSPEREPFFMLENNRQDTIIGIVYTKPDMFKESYWIGLLKNQIDCDGKRQLTLLGTEVKTFEDLRNQVQGLSESQRDDFLSGILKQISKATRIILMEKDEKKDMPKSEQESGPLNYSEEKHTFLGRINPKAYSPKKLKEFLDGAILSNLNGKPMRLHMVFPIKTHVLTEDDFKQTRTMSMQELDEFKDTCTKRMGCSQMIFVLRKEPSKLTSS